MAMRKTLMVVAGIVVAWNVLTQLRTLQAKRAMVRLQPKPSLTPRPTLPVREPRPTLPTKEPVVPLAPAGSDRPA